MDGHGDDDTQHPHLDVPDLRVAGTPGLDIALLAVADTHSHGQPNDESSSAASENIDTAAEVSSDEIDDEYYESMFYKTNGRCNHVIITKMKEGVFDSDKNGGSKKTWAQTMEARTWRLGMRAEAGGTRAEREAAQK
jgi:hypothetical protein